MIYPVLLSLFVFISASDTSRITDQYPNIETCKLHVERMHEKFMRNDRVLVWEGNSFKSELKTGVSTWKSPSPGNRFEGECYDTKPT